MKSVITLAVLAALAAESSAQLSYSSDFDSLTAGSSLAGQDGWIAGSSGTSANVPSVATGTAFSGANSVQLAYAGTGGTFISVGRAFAAGTPAATPFLSATGKVYVASVAGADRYFGFGFGTSALATGGYAGIALGGNGLRGGAGSYSSYNSLTGGLLQARTTDDFLNRWVTLTMTADRSITSNNVTYTFSGLGTSGGSATSTFTQSVAFSATASVADIQLFSDWGSSSTVQGSAYVDNVSFSTSPVPEPSAFAGLGLGVLAMLRRRRRA